MTPTPFVPPSLQQFVSKTYSLPKNVSFGAAFNTYGLKWSKTKMTW
jgi:hypothetical protein